MSDIVFGKKIGNLGIMRPGKGNEILVILVPADDIDQILKPGLAVENSSFSVHYVFLQIKSNVFGYAEIFQCVRNSNSHLIAYSEKMIYSCLAGENYSRKIIDVDFLMSEIFG
jgi:hypothetical protein